MRKSFSIMIILGFILIGNPVSVQCRSKKVSKSDMAKAVKYKKESNSYQLLAKKAEKSGYQELANLYQKCAQCKLTIAKGYVGKASKNEIKTAEKDLKETSDKIKVVCKKLKKEAKRASSKSSKGREQTKQQNKKKRRKLSMEERAAKYKLQADKFKKMALQQSKLGNEDEALYYEKLSKTTLKISEAYKKRDISAAKKAKEEYFKAKASGE